jgi:hypothetical protein
MHENEDLWYRIGYALEKVRQRLPAATPSGSVLPSGSDGTPESQGRSTDRMTAALRKAREKQLDATSSKVLEVLLTLGAGTALTRVLTLLPGRRRPGLFRLLKGGAAGAAASFLSGLARPLISGKPSDGSLEEELTDILLSGAGRGLLYAALIEPRVPRPPLLQGTAYGALEWALSPWGGLEELAGSAAPQHKVPVLSVLLKNRGDEEQFLEHLAFGIALALLYDR